MNMKQQLIPKVCFNSEKPAIALGTIKKLVAFKLINNRNQCMDHVHCIGKRIKKQQEKHVRTLIITNKIR